MLHVRRTVQIKSEEKLKKCEKLTKEIKMLAGEMSGKRPKGRKKEELSRSD